MVCDNERSVNVLVDKAEPLVKLHRNADRVDREPLAVPLDFRFVKRDNYLSDLPREPPARVDRFEAEHLIQNDIVCATLLAHQKVNRFRSHKVDFQFQPEKSSLFRHAAASYPNPPLSSKSLLSPP